jgi:hypothetical protein
MLRPYGHLKVPNQIAVLLLLVAYVWTMGIFVSFHHHDYACQTAATAGSVVGGCANSDLPGINTLSDRSSSDHCAICQWMLTGATILSLAPPACIHTPVLLETSLLENQTHSSLLLDILSTRGPPTC